MADARLLDSAPTGATQAPSAIGQTTKPTDYGDKRIAIVQEWIAAPAGSEKVFAALAAIFPGADLFALSETPGVRLDGVGTRRLRTTFLNRPAVRDRRGATLPIMPMAWKALFHEPYDLVLSSSHAFARWFVSRRDSVHLSYVHAPMRYAWSPEIDDRGDRYGAFGASARSGLRYLDQRSLDSTNDMAANSSAVAQRVGRYYRREARVIPPPVATDKFLGPNSTQGYLITGGRLIPYKRHDLAIRTAAAVGMPLVVFGTGPEERALQNLADEVGAKVDFAGHASDEELSELLRGADAFLFPAVEDFGILAVEALSAGTPVVGIADGGAVDIADGGTCVELAQTQTVDELAAATERLLAAGVSAKACRQRAANFDEAAFARRITEWVGGYV